jgi:hypothetical protein
MKPKIYKILNDAVEVGISRGYRRAFKHSDTPSEEHILTSIETEVMNEISEYFTFTDTDYEL